MANSKTKATEITSDDIRELRAEALNAGDRDMVALCDQALSSDEDASVFAWSECRRVIEYARMRAAEDTES